MPDKTGDDPLDAVLTAMLRRVRGIPLHRIIPALCGRNVIRFDPAQPADARLLVLLEQAVRHCAEEVRRKPIRRPRPNEVGNDIEAYVMRALHQVGLRPSLPTSAAGQARSTGYPDLLIHDEEGRPTYLECKIFAEGTDPTSMRSFYLSPSEAPKVSLDARHLLLAYGMEATAISGSRDSQYRPHSFRLVDLHDLSCDVKYEFNSDNRRLYAPGLTLLQGKA